MLNLNHFYYFYMVAEAGSVTAAAKALHISQPALSKQLKTFENSLNTKLFEKSGRGLRLTSTGLSLFGHARGMFEKAEYINREFVSTHGTAREQVRLGLGASIERAFASDLVRDFFLPLTSNRNAQEYSLSISSLEGGSLSRYLHEQVIDACITERQLSGPGLLAIASVTMPICLLLPRSSAHRLNRGSRMNLSSAVEALELPWIIPTTNLRFRYVVDSILEKHGIELEPILESDSMITMVRSVENGIGIALVPKQYIKTARDPKRILALDGLRSVPEVKLSLWVRQKDSTRAYIKKLASAFEKSTSKE